MEISIVCAQSLEVLETVIHASYREAELIVQEWAARGQASAARGQAS